MAVLTTEKQFVPRIDLHMHSTRSDGTDSPGKLLDKVREAGLAAFSLTDHDEYRGSEKLLQQMKREKDARGPVFITGAEFSCRDGEDKFHILGYAYDTQSPAMHDLSAVFHRIRLQKVRNRMIFLKDTYGFEFSDREMEELMKNPNPGKPHIAKLMMRHGYAGSIREAVEDFIGNYEGPEQRIRPEEAIEAVRAAGGIPVLAHGPFGDGEQDLGPEEMEARVLRLSEAGLMGVEAYYSTFSEAQCGMMLSLADRHGLLVTAGSDYHGKIKTVRLGDTGPGSPEEKAARLSDFLAEALKREAAVFCPEGAAAREELTCIS